MNRRIPRSLGVLPIPLAALCALALPSSAALAQPGVGPAVPPAGVVRQNFFSRDSEDLARLSERLTGMSRGSGHTLRIEPVKVPGAARALYVEMVEDGRENAPMVQQVWIPHLRGSGDGEMRVRIFELPVTMRAYVIGMWAAPDLWPQAGMEQFKPIGDLDATLNGETATLSHGDPFPIIKRDGIETNIAVSFAPDQTMWRDSGADEHDLQVWNNNLTMRRLGANPRALRNANGAPGLIVWDLRAGTGPAAENKDSVAINWASFLVSSGQLIDKNTGVSGREDMAAYFFTIPSDKVIPGWNFAVIGAQHGTIRRAYIPAALAFGPNQAGVIPPNSDLLFEIEVTSVKDNTP